jgi:hypothetical protein
MLEQVFGRQDEEQSDGRPEDGLGGCGVETEGEQR